MPNDGFFNIRFDLSDTKRLDRLFPLLNEQVEDLHPTFEKVAEYTGLAFQRIWVWGQSHWRPLAASTIERKRRLLAAGKISVAPETKLVETTRLRESLVNRSHRDHVEFISKDRMVYGSSVEYALIHEEGGGNIPQREILNTDILIPQMSRAIEDTIPADLRRAIKGD